jgi:hypothetical protein
MLWWLVDHAGLFYFLLGLAAVGLAAAWWLNRQVKYLLGAVFVIGLLFLVWLLGRLIVTDRQHLQRNIEEMAQAVGDNKPGEIVKHLAADFDYQGIKKSAAEDRLGSAIRGHGVTFVRVWGFDVEHLSRAEGKAIVEFQARVDTRANEPAFLCRCRTEFVLEGEKWRLRTFKILPPLGSGDQEIRIPLH